MLDFTIYVTVYVRHVSTGQYIDAGKDHRLGFIISAADGAAALVKFRIDHPGLIVDELRLNPRSAQNASTPSTFFQFKRP